MPVPWPILLVGAVLPVSWAMKLPAPAAFAAAVALLAVFRFSTPIVPIMPVCLSRYVARATWLQLAELTAAWIPAPSTASTQSRLSLLFVRRYSEPPAAKEAGYSSATVSGTGSSRREAMYPYAPSEGVGDTVAAGVALCVDAARGGDFLPGPARPRYTAAPPMSTIASAPATASFVVPWLFPRRTDGLRPDRDRPGSALPGAVRPGPAPPGRPGGAWAGESVPALGRVRPSAVPLLRPSGSGSGAAPGRIGAPAGLRVPIPGPGL